MTTLLQTIKRLGRATGFSITTIVTLAIGIGATTAIFSVVNGILLNPLPYPDSDRLVALRHQVDRQPALDLAASPALYFTYRDHNEAFESVALWYSGTASVTGMGNPQVVELLRATTEFLPTLRVAPLLGRNFTAAEDQPGSALTVLLSHAYWQRMFGGAESALGQSMTIDGALHEIVGVLPPGFRFLDRPADVLVPAQLNRALAFAGSTGENGIARLRDGVTMVEASADVERMLPVWAEEFPVVPGIPPTWLEDFAPNLRALKAEIVGDLDDVLWVLMGTIGMLLVIACANVANLQLVRSEARERELSIRVALGAGWANLAKGLVTESLLLGVAAGGLGLGLAVVGLPVLLAAAAGDLPGALVVTIDTTVVLFCAGISLAAGVLAALVPVLRYASPRVAASLNASARSATGTREQHRVRNVLVIGQVALALVLLVSAGLMLRTLTALRDIDPGYSAPGQVQTFSVSIPQAEEPDYAVVKQRLAAIQDRVAAVAGVDTVGFSSRLPLVSSGPSGPFTLESRTGEGPLSLQFRYLSPGVFDAWGAPLVAGRPFNWEDSHQSRLVGVVSESFAVREFGSAAAAVGQRLRRSENAPWFEIVGVAGDVRHRGFEQAADDTIYLPLVEFAQFSRTKYFFVRSQRTGTAGFVDDIRQAIWSVEPELPIAGIQTLADIEDGALAQTSLTLLLLSITATMALLLGLIGIYGVISYLLARQARELGIRLALGARAAALARLVFGRVLMLVVIGAGTGIVAAAVLGRLMQSLLFGVAALDPVTFVVVAVALVVTTLAAGMLPALRIARIDPSTALRAE